MTTNTDVANRALQVIGTRTTVTDAELANNTSNEAIQINLILTKYRDQLLRMAPWNCGLKYANLAYLTSIPGTPENSSPATNLWTPGQPAPPYAYEYMYPDDCLRVCFLIPSTQTGFGSGVPITTAVTGGASAFWQGQPVKYKVAVDDYLRQANGLITIITPGSGYTIGDSVICGGIPSIQGSIPAGLINLNVVGTVGGGVVAAALLPFTNLNKDSLLFSVPTYNLNQVSSSGLGTGLVVSIATLAQGAFSARTILTNQEYATAAYVKQVTDPNVMDDDFVEAWAHAIGAGVAIALTGDKGLANLAISTLNAKIAEARRVDGNEGLTVNDVTPDWIRIRGIDFAGTMTGPWSGFDWGPDWPMA